MKLPELAGEVGLLEMLGNFTGLPAACECKVNQTISIGPFFLPTHNILTHACPSHQGPSPMAKALILPANNPLAQAGPQNTS